MNRSQFIKEFAIFFCILIFLPFLFWEGLGVFEVGIIPSVLFSITCFAISSIACKHQPRVIQCSFWLFVYIFLLIAPVSQQLAGYFPWYSNYHDSDINSAWLIVLAGCVPFFVVTNLPSRQNETQTSFVFEKSKFKIFCLVSIPVFLIALSRLGGFSTMFLPRDEISALFGGDVSDSMITQALLRIPPFIISLFFLTRFLAASTTKMRKKSLFLFFVFAAVTLIINNPVATARFWVACIILTYLLFFLIYKKTRVNVIYLSLMLFLTIFVFPVSDAFRRSTDVSVADYFNATNISEGFVVSANYDSFQQVVNAIGYVEANGHSYGGRMLSALFFWVPRSVMPAKYASSGEDLAVFARYDFTNLSTPLWAEVFLDFGTVGVIFFFLAFGFLIKRIDNMVSGVPNIYIIFISAYGIYFLRGTLLAVIGFFAVTLFFLFLLRNNKKGAN